MEAKVRAAVRARRDPNFVIIARTDARAVEGMAAALRRAERYRKAGADAIFPEALESETEFRAFGRKKSLGWLIANMTEFGRSPLLTVSELARLGFHAVLYPMTAFRAAARAAERTLKDLRRGGDNRSLLERLQTRRELYDLNRYADFDRREARFLADAKKLRRGKHV
jgi:methylisocitrate lyase